MSTTGLPERLIQSAEQSVADQARAQLFFREFALHMAKQAVRDFGPGRAPEEDGAAAVAAYLEHENEQRRLKPNEITSHGRGFQVNARVSSCAYQKTCKNNLKELGEVPQCVRAITLIQAVGARIPTRPPMTYDLRPGLVDGKAATCDISLRPAVLPDLVPLNPNFSA